MQAATPNDNTTTPPAPARAALPMYLSWGLGLESSAILVRWILDPASRDFPLEDLTVIVAMTGDEHQSTRRECEEHILPLLRRHNIRLVQVARGGYLESEGVVILDDSRQPQRLYTEGAYKLSDKMLLLGVVPAFGGTHRCALHFKAHVLDSWVRGELDGRGARRAWGYNRDEVSRIQNAEEAMRLAGDKLPHRMAFGFNRDEQSRIDRSGEYDGLTRFGEYPLSRESWNWSRQDCSDYIFEQLGYRHKKSACVYCPFNALKADGLARLREEPEAAGFAMFLEYVSLCFNHRGTLYSGKSLHSVMVKDGNTAALTDFERRLAECDYALYRVKRIYHRKGSADRSVEKLATGSRAELERRFAVLVEADERIVVREMRGITYAYKQERAPDEYPAFEDFYVIAPATVEDKARGGLANFDGKWMALNPQADQSEHVPQLSLLSL